MPFDFLRLPAELRQEIYEILLVRAQPISLRLQSTRAARHVLTFNSLLLDAVLTPDHWQPAQLCPSVLALNKQVYNEAVPVLYSSNGFHCSRRSKTFFGAQENEFELIGEFFDIIGDKNARRIRHICMSFPECLYLDYYTAGEQFMLSMDGKTRLDMVRSRAPDITKLEFLPAIALDQAWLWIGMRRHDLSADDKVEVLAMLKHAFDEFGALTTVVVHVAEGHHSDLQTQMRSLGWTLVEEDIDPENDYFAGLVDDGEDDDDDDFDELYLYEELILDSESDT